MIPRETLRGSLVVWDGMFATTIAAPSKVGLEWFVDVRIMGGTHRVNLLDLELAKLDETQIEKLAQEIYGTDGQFGTEAKDFSGYQLLTLLTLYRAKIIQIDPQEVQEIYANLTSTQDRCTALINEVRYYRKKLKDRGFDEDLDYKACAEDGGDS